MRRALMVSVESPWPSTHGGRLRTARVAEALAGEFDVIVTFPASDLKFEDAMVASCPGSIVLEPIEWSAPGQMSTRISAAPHLGNMFARPIGARLAELIEFYSPHVVIWTHSYLAASARSFVPSGLPQVVEFANIERDRFRSFATEGRWLARSSAFLEYVKARSWEPRLAASADLAVALTDSDLAILQGWGARAVLARNGITPRAFIPSGDSSVVLAVANWRYGANAHAIRRFVQQDWPRVTALRPGSRLEVVGKGGEMLEFSGSVTSSVTIRGYVDDLSSYYRSAALVLAPATSGGGSQLKVTEALGYCRTVVGLGLARELRRGMPRGAIAVPDDLPVAIAGMLDDASARQRLEVALHAYVKEHTWAKELASLVEAVQRMVE